MNLNNEQILNQKEQKILLILEENQSNRMGLTHYSIACKLNCSPSTAYNWLKILEARNMAKKITNMSGKTTWKKTQ